MQRKVIPKMVIKTVPITTVTPYEKNPRRIPAEAVEKVAASIQEYGWRQPISVDEHYVVLAGHTRLKAAHHLGLTEVPVEIAYGISEEKARAFRLADNRVAEGTNWDITKLREEVLGISTGALVGWTQDELAAIMFDVEEEAGVKVKDATKGRHRTDGMVTVEFVVPRAKSKAVIMHVQAWLEKFLLDETTKGVSQ